MSSKIAKDPIIVEYASFKAAITLADDTKLSSELNSDSVSNKLPLRV